MEGKETSIPRGIPRLSRLPVPRASATDTRHHDSHKTSQLPRPSATNSIRSRPRVSLPVSIEHPPPSNHSRSSQQSRNLSPEKHIQPATHPESSEPELPNNDAFDELENNENLMSDLPNVQRQKRKPPRPSLSERTMETLSQISPTPSPVRPRPGTATGHFSMGPPSTPASALRSSRSNASLRDRNSSPSKQVDHRFGHPKSRSKGVTPLRPGPSTAIAFSPVQNLAANSRIAVSRGKRVSNRDPILVGEDEQTQGSSSSSVPRNRQAKLTYDSKLNIPKVSATRASSNPTSGASLKSIPTESKPSSRLGLNQNREIRQSKPGVPQKDIASARSSSVSRQRLPVKPVQSVLDTDEASRDKPKRTVSKSSLTLRETIAKAKAAKRKAEQKRPTTPSNPANSVLTQSVDYEIETLAVGDTNEKTLKKRIEGAVKSGVLNIAAMGLKVLPDSIQTMYDSNANPNMNWSEAVDLARLNAADNEIEELSEIFFPDWSVQELREDEDKSNQFGGLQVLDLRGNQLTNLTIGLRRLEQLNTLVLNNNYLETNALEIICQIQHLKELRLANNNFRGALPSALQDLTELQILDIHSNHLSVLPDSIERLCGLRKLDISDNSFDNVPMLSLQGLPLVELNLSKNSLSGTLFCRGLSMERLQTLNVASNMLSALSEGDLEFPALQTLVCDNNRMRNLPSMGKLESLVSLTASDNQIEDFPDGFGLVKTLRNVDLSANQISLLDVQIANMENLASLNISANPLRERKYLTMSTDKLKIDLSKRVGATEIGDENVDASVAGDLESDGVVRVDDTKKGHVPEKGVLNLASQNLRVIDLSTIDLAGPVHTVRLSNNDLAEFPVELLTHPNVKHTLRSLDLSHTPSLHSNEYLTQSLTLPALQSLNIVGTGLTSLTALVTHLSAPQLRELNISCHRMTGAVPRLQTTFPALTTLLATDNWFTSVDVEALAGLEVVDISNNDIDHLPPRIGELGNLVGSKAVSGRLRAFECKGNKFRVPRAIVLEKGTEAILKDLRRMVPAELVGDEWKE